MKETHRHSFGELYYVMKKHWATRLHYDLRLWWNGILLSWAIPVGQGYSYGEARTAIEMEDHDAANILFEGIHRTGPIMVWDRGTWEPHAGFGDVLASLAKGVLQFTLRGEKLDGLVTLTRKDIEPGSHRPVWSLQREAGLFTGSSADTLVPEMWRKSITTGRTQEQIVHDWNRTRAEQPSLF